MIQNICNHIKHSSRQKVAIGQNYGLIISKHRKKIADKLKMKKSSEQHRHKKSQN